MEIKEKHSPSKLVRDLGAIITSIVTAYLLSESGVLEIILAASRNWQIIGSFVAGIFFTSIFTVAIATVTLAEISLFNNIWLTALIGGAGAVIGDLLIFRFLKDNISEDITELIKHSKRFRMIFKLRFFRFLFPFLGAIIIASPLPDEIGLTMMGVINLKIRYVIPISYILNSTGILIISLAARNLINQ